MRPKKTRTVKCSPGERCFEPRCKIGKPAKAVVVTLDEYEAVRLVDLEGMHHAEAAKELGVSRPTLSRIIESAHGKIADGLVNIKKICIEGGCCSIKGKA